MAGIWPSASLLCLQSTEALVPSCSSTEQTKEGEEKSTDKEALTHLLLLDKSKFMCLSAFEPLLSP